jgi:NAD(P)H-hydrate epimerase
MAGAAVLASEAAYRSGAGLVYLAAPDALVDVLSVKQTCGVVLPLPARGAAGRILALAEERDAAVIGPGLSAAAHADVRRVVPRLRLPFVLDADGLNAFAGRVRDLARCTAPRVLTPHPGEAARLLGTTAAAIQSDRPGAARKLAKLAGGVVVLKGHRTIVDDGRRRAVNRTGNPGMATGGTGDVLAGVIGALLGQGLAPFDAAVLGVFVHGRAGDLAARESGETSLMATDLLAALPRAFRST